MADLVYTLFDSHYNKNIFIHSMSPGSIKYLGGSGSWINQPPKQCTHMSMNETVVVRDATSETLARSLEFTNIINLYNYDNNDRFTLSNGSYVLVNKSSTPYKLQYVCADGTSVTNLDVYTNHVYSFFWLTDTTSIGKILEDTYGIANMYISFEYRTGDGCSCTSITGVGRCCPKTNTLSGTTLTKNNKFYQGTEYYTDPYIGGGPSGEGGGTGNFDGSSTPIAIPGLPTLSAVDAGFITLFNPSSAQLKSLAQYMWTNPLFDLDNWRKIFADPMDAILGLSIVPVAVPNGGSGTVTVGNISTGVSMTLAGSQYVAVDCGSLTVQEYWGSYLDYEPFTKIQIYLPYIGTRPLSTDDVMGKTIQVVYHVDILSGACNAFVKCGDSVLYTFNGQCASSIPITGNDWTNVINGIITASVAVGTLAATGGAAAPLAVPSLAATAVNTMKPEVEKSGSLTGTGGMLGIQTPYLIVTRPRQALPANQNKYTGYPSFITAKLSTLSGFTIVEDVHLENMTATEAEINEIEQLLKSGVIF